METTDQEQQLKEAPPILVLATSTSSSLHQPQHDGDEEENTEAAAAAAAAIFLGRPLDDEKQKKKRKESVSSTELQETATAASAAPAPTSALSMVETTATNGRPREEAAIVVEAAAPAADTTTIGSSAHQQCHCWRLPGGGGAGSRVKFCTREVPAMTDSERRVRFLGRFRFGDTYKLKMRHWLMPQFLSGALTLTGVVLTLVGVISLQINKYLHACDAQDGLDCKTNKASINNVMMPIGVGSTGGGLSLILISLFVFVHAFCIIYDDPDNEDNEVHDGVLHIPSSSRAALLGSATALSRLPDEAVELARCQSYYDNLQDYVAPR